MSIQILCNAVSSSGIMLHVWSGPYIFLSKVKCFSKICAPREKATIAAEIPTVWSLKPEYLLKSTEASLQSNSDAGYWGMQYKYDALKQ